MQIEITLLSDACMASGETYNNSIDTDVQYDKYGLPFIGAKRLKGCLRECALELADWGDDIPVEVMFGKENHSPARIQISNAKLADYDTYVQEIVNTKDKTLVHPQKVLGQFTYNRSQTRIDVEKGIAKNDTLRVTRVLKKGLVFLANVVIEGDEKGIYKTHLENCCKTLRHMGMNRTRGMGNVKVRLIEGEVKHKKTTQPVWDDAKKYSGLEYKIALKTATVFKSVAGGTAKTVDYIDGAKVLGVLASRMRVEGENAFVDFMNQGQLQCTNAYISVNDKRALPMAASLMKVKNTNDEGRNLAAINVPEVEEKQLVQASNGYAVYYDGKIYTADINKQIRYHHSRPVDKGVGHVLANDDSQFYQIESLAEGQSFIGSIYGTNEQVKKVYELLTKDVNVRVGAGKNTEYGEAEITITALVECNEDTPKMAKRFVVKCNAATILYNEFGMYSTEKKDVEFAINALLGTDKAVTIQQEFVKCVEIGGYNVTWNAKKPTLLAIDKGSLFVCEVNEEIDLTKYNVAFIGERNSEGYGEITVEEVPEEYVVSYTKKTPKSTENIQQMSANTSKELSSMMYGLLKQDVKEDVEEIAIAKAVEMKKALKNEENINAIVNQLVLIQKQSDNETDFIKAIRARYDRDTQKKQHKQNVAFKLIEKANEKSPVDNVMENVVNKCEIRIEKDEVYQWYYKALLGQLKYYIREKGV